MAKTPVATRSLAARLRRAISVIHLWLGLSVGAYLCAVCLSGSIVVFIDDISALSTLELTHRVAPPGAGASPLPLSEALRRVRSRHPEIPAASFARLYLSKTSGAALSLQVSEASFLDTRIVTINPYTGAVMHNRPRLAPWLRWADSLHIQLLAGMTGETVNSLLGLVSGVLLLSGLWLWWPAKLRLLRQRLTVKTSAGAKRFNYDLHNALGFYTLPLLLVLSLTGAIFAFWLSLSKWVERATHTKSYAPEVKLSQASPAKYLALERLAAIAERTGPRQELVSVAMPQKAGQPFTAQKGTQREGLLPLTTITLDPVTGRVLQVYSDASAPMAHKIMYVAYALHLGWWGGWTTMVIYAVAGVAPLALYVTGVVIWLRKRRGRGRATFGEA